MGFLRTPDEGQAPETSLAALEGSTCPPGRGRSHDMGCQGDTCAGITSIQPTNKPPGGALTPPEQGAPRAISSLRLRIEPASGGVKRYRLVKATIRLLQDGSRETLLETWGGLHNVRLQYRPWNYAS